MTQEPLYKTFLRQELEHRQKKNGSYSLRAFASFLEVSPGSLSRALNGKASLSIKVLTRALDKLAVTERERARYLASTIVEQQRAAAKKSGLRLDFPQKEIPLEEFDASLMDGVSEWYHFAILELTTLDGFKLSPRTIGSALGITQDQAESAMIRLLQTGLLMRTKTGFKKAKAIFLNKNRNKMTSNSIRKSLDQMLEKAQDSLKSDPLAERSMTAMSIPIDPKKIPVAKLMIEQFVLQMCDYLSCERKERVYNLNVNLFPLQILETP